LASALERLIRLHSGGSDPAASLETAIAYARRWLALDPLHEPAQRQLMRLYAWDGQQAAALRQYQECERILAEELGGSPDEETTALYEAIKAKRLPAPDQVMRPEKTVSPTPPYPATSAAPPAAPRHNLPPNRLPSSVGNKNWPRSGSCCSTNLPADC
jgi:hypothetical protein